ncbi:hypothetical protein ACLB2K_035935 [Fragaria x ananassa]
MAINGITSSTGHISIVIEDDSTDTTDVEALQDRMMNNLGGDSPFSDICCIFRVPQVLRRHNPKAYTPDVVSIGPFHHGGTPFQRMEKVKQWYLRNLLSRMNISLRLLIEEIIRVEKQARDFYSEPLDHLNQSSFVEMMVLDCCFLLELFRKFRDKEDRHISDPIFNMDCMFQYICHDLLLLENQIPWFLLNCLYTLTLDPKDDPSLRKLMLTVFSSHHQLAHNCLSYLRHLNHNVHDEDDDDGKILHILDLIRTSIVFPFKDQFDLSFYDSETELMHHALALSEAGVSFRRASSTRSIMNIEFKDGTLAIPQLAIGELTDSLFRNLIAFEQCYPGHSHKITSYAVLMDNLIGSNNWLSAEDASKFFVKLYYDTVLDKFYYGGLCSKLNKHYDHKWKMWREKFKRTYCSDPWKFISLTAAFILLLLTLLQTIYTIVQACTSQIHHHYLCVH